MSMAAGEYVSVSSQADSEAADLKREQRALRERPAEEKEELAHIYEERGLKPKLAKQVAGQLMAKDALDAHARDELGLNEAAKPNPIQAAGRRRFHFRSAPRCRPLQLSSRRTARSSSPSPPPRWSFSSRSVRSARRLGGATIVRPALRVGFWGALAMAVTAGIGAIVGKAV